MVEKILSNIMIEGKKILWYDMIASKKYYEISL